MTNNDNNFSTHLSLIHIKTVFLKESEAFYDLVYKKIGLEKKNKENGTITYWGPFGIQITEQKNIIAHLEPDFRLGFTQISIKVSTKKEVDEIYQLIHQYGFSTFWKPKKFDYGNDYYSTCLADPDNNKIEFVYSK